MNLGAQLIKQVASKTNDDAGDGTTTATVLARAIFREGCKSVAAGLNPMDLKRGMSLAIDKVVDVLTKGKKDITTRQEVASVGTISANGDKSIGNMLALALEKVGKEGAITVAEGRTLVDDVEFVEGLKWERGFISPYFINNSASQRVELENTYVLVSTEKISSVQAIAPLLEQVLQTNSSLLIVAEDIEEDALAALVINKIRAKLKVCAVKAPGFGDNRKLYLQDIAIVTGATLFNPEVGTKLEEATLEQLGRVSKVTVTKDDTLLMDGKGSKEDIKDRIELLRQELKLATRPFEIEKLNERIARMSGGVAIIKVGGVSETEVTEKKERVTDALNATKAASLEGILPGGGTALLYASQVLDSVKLDNFDQSVGVRIIRDALRVPTFSIAQNAGVDGGVVVGKLLQLSGGNPFSTLGYNAATGEYVDMIQSGILDPLKIVRCALQDAGSIASLMTTTEAAIVEEQVESDKKL